MGKGIFLGANVATFYNGLFEDVKNSKNETESNTFRGSGTVAGLHFMYSFNNKDHILLQYSRNTFSVEHNSLLLYGGYNPDEVTTITTDSLISQSGDFSSFRFQYYKKFYPRDFSVGIGFSYDIDKNNTSKEYIRQTRKRLNGVVTAGLDYRSKYFVFYPYLEYSFPITNYKEEGVSSISMSEITLGLRVSLKFL